MSDETSARLQLPLLRAGQAQKELWHNEALALLDLAVQASVVAVGVDTPPAMPAIGACWVVGTAPTGAWSGRAGAIAGWTAGGWRFVAAREGLAVWDQATGAEARHRAGAWTSGILDAQRLVIDGVPVIGAQRPAIADPVAGEGDAGARATLAAVLTALRAHGLIAD